MARRRRKLHKNESYITLGSLVVFGAVLSLFGHKPILSDTVTAIYIVVAIGSAVGTILLVVWYFQEQQRVAALKALRITDVHVMSGVEFEKYVAEILKSQGYRVMLTKTSGDYGVDIVAQRGGEKTAVQVKRYKGAVGQEAVREAVAGMTHYRCRRSMVITNSSFTPFAKSLASSNNCELIDGVGLGKWILEFRR